MKVIVKNARLGFNDLFDAKAVGDSDVLKYSATLICSEDTTIVYTNGEGKKVSAPFEKMQNICDHVAKEKFGKVPAKLSNWAFNKADGSTTRDEYLDKDGEYYEGFDEDTFYISATKQKDMCPDGKLTVLDQGKEPIAANSGKIFSGCYVNAVLDVYAFPGGKGYKDGVSASLEGVQLKKKGEALGFSPIDAADEFDEEEVEFEGEEGGSEADDLL